MTDRQFRELLRVLNEILRAVKPQHNYSVVITLIINHIPVAQGRTNNMKLKAINAKVGALGGLISPGTATLEITLLDNGVPYVNPQGSGYVFDPTISADDNSITMTADATIENQVDISIPAGDTATQITFTASAIAPDGTTVTATLSVPLAPAPVASPFTLSLSQTS